MNSSPASAPFARPRRTAAERETRRIRIFGMLRAGHSYEAIARQERLSRERVRQIVAKSLARDKDGTLPDPDRVQLARLEPALRLAASAIDDGNVQAIPHLLRILERLDKYGAVAKAQIEEAAVIHARLMKKMTRALANADREKAAAAAKAEGAAQQAAQEAVQESACPPLPEAAEPDLPRAKNLETRDSGLQAEPSP